MPLRPGHILPTNRVLFIAPDKNLNQLLSVPPVLQPLFKSLVSIFFSSNVAVFLPLISVFFISTLLPM